MAELTVLNLGHLRVNVAPAQTVLNALQTNGIDWMHACGAKGRCTTCRMIVVSGMEHISPESQPELKYREAGRLKPNERLTCQCTLISGEVTIRVPKQTQLPHVKYAEKNP